MRDNKTGLRIRREYHALVAVTLILILCACGSGGGTAGDGTGGGSQSSDPAAAQQCVDTINQYRAGVGLPALARWTDGEGCADEEAESDSASGEFHGAFGSCGESAQNECPDYDSVSRVIDVCLELMWDEGPGGGHYDNMTNTSYAEVACGFATKSDGLIWSVQNFR